MTFVTFHVTIYMIKFYFVFQIYVITYNTFLYNGFRNIKTLKMPQQRKFILLHMVGFTAVAQLLPSCKLFPFLIFTGKLETRKNPETTPCYNKLIAWLNVKKATFRFIFLVVWVKARKHMYLLFLSNKCNSFQSFL